MVHIQNEVVKELLTYFYLIYTYLIYTSLIFRFFTVLEKLVASGMTTRPTILGFCQSVLQLISKVADHLDNKELLWRLWSVVVNPLLEHVKEVKTD